MGQGLTSTLFAVLILLPPSEGKSSPAGDHRLDLGELSYASLNAARIQMVEAVSHAAASGDALRIFGVTASLADAVRANIDLLTSPARPAIEVYAGVLYDALDWQGLSADAQARGAESLLIFSGLFGVLGPLDAVPAYRLSGDTRLPGVGRPAAFWRDRLGSVLPDDDLVIDCRSSTYAAFWTPARRLTVRVFREQAGRRTVVSHMAKHFRGLLTRALLQAPANLVDASDAASTASRWFADRELRMATGQPITVTIETTPTSIDLVTS